VQRIVDGQRLELDDLGDGVSVLMLHGFPLDRRSLMTSVGPVFERRAGYRRLHVDLPGFGASLAATEITSSDATVDFVLRLIDETVGDAPLLVIGESWGAYLARGVVARRAEQVRGVALLCPVIIATHADRRVPDHRILYEEPGIFDGADQQAVAAFREWAVVADRGAWEYVQSSIGPAVAAADAGAAERIGSRYAFAEDIDRVGAPFAGPSLIIAGRQDSIVGYRDAVDILERFPRATFVVLDAAGHNLQAERPRVVASLVDDWLDRVELARAEMVAAD
jgi:pimeloyl-ACP methyl ester carboxylesterase